MDRKPKNNINENKKRNLWRKIKWKFLIKWEKKEISNQNILKFNVEMLTFKIQRYKWN